MGRLALATLLVACVLAMSGCAKAGASVLGVAPQVVAVVVAVWKARRLHDDRGLQISGAADADQPELTDLGQHVRFFIRKRAEHLLAPPSGGALPHDQAVAEIGRELDLVKQLHTELLGWPDDLETPFLLSTDQPLGHVDLADVVQFYEPAKPDTATAADVSNARGDRRRIAPSIIWRAAALEPALWSPSWDPATVKSSLKLLLDRRLHLVELMNWIVNSGIDPVNTRIGEHGRILPRTGTASWDANELKNNGNGPWHDGLRRTFEYPEINAGQLADAIKDQQQRGIANANWKKMASGLPVWRETLQGPDLQPRDFQWRLRPPAMTGFGRNFPDPHHILVRKQPTFSGPLAALFHQTNDFWDRTWMYCDHVISALHMQSLRFGLRRRAGPAVGDATFDALFDAHTDGWARLRPLLPSQRPTPEMLLGGDPYFLNEPVQDLQVGDHVVFWNSILYPFLHDGAWTLENAVIVELRTPSWIANDPTKGVMLAGHGAEKQASENFQRHVATILDRLLQANRNKVAGQPGPTLATHRSDAPLVRWNPTGDAFTLNGAPTDPWWVRIPFDAPDRTLSRKDTMRTLPDAVDVTDRANAPNIGLPRSCALFPLYFPTHNQKWNSFLERRAGGWTPGAADLQLSDSQFGGENIPGLLLWQQFAPGVPPERPWISAVRPKVG